MTSISCAVLHSHTLHSVGILSTIKLANKGLRKSISFYKLNLCHRSGELAEAIQLLKDILLSYKAQKFRSVIPNQGTHEKSNSINFVAMCIDNYCMLVNIIHWSQKFVLNNNLHT